jgi:hypothetical protein
MVVLRKDPGLIWSRKETFNDLDVGNFQDKVILEIDDGLEKIRLENPGKIISRIELITEDNKKFETNSIEFPIRESQESFY